MTREEALQVLIIKANKGAFVEDIINQIFDEHEAQLKAKDEEIEKLKEEVKYLQSELDDYDKFHETIASARP